MDRVQPRPVRGAVYSNTIGGLTRSTSFIARMALTSANAVQSVHPPAAVSGTNARHVGHHPHEVG